MNEYEIEWDGGEDEFERGGGVWKKIWGIIFYIRMEIKMGKLVLTVKWVLPLEDGIAICGSWFTFCLVLRATVPFAFQMKFMITYPLLKWE